MQKITIFGIISASTSESVKFQIDSFDRNQPLFVEVNSDGGSVSDGIAIYNLLRGWTGGVTVEVVGWALSIASVILQAGSRRIAHESALVMVHAPWTSNTGNSASMRDSAALLEQVASTMFSIYRRTGQPDPVVSKWLAGEDHWFSASEAKTIGLVDEVISNTDQIANTSARFIPANAGKSLHKVPKFFSQKVNMPSQQAPNQSTANAAFLQQDASRRSEIRSSFSGLMSREGVPALLAACEADINCTRDIAANRLLAHLGSGCSPVMGGRAPASFGDDRVADFKAAACDVLLSRSGVKVAEMHPAAHDLQRMGIVAMCESILSMTGVSTRGMSPSAIISAGLSTSDFPSLLSNTAGKSMALGYENAPSGHALFTAERDVRDFKEQTLVHLGESPSLLKVPELGEYRRGALLDSASKFQLATFGRMLQISRQALVNDDLSAFTTLPQSLGAAARRLESDMVFEQLNQNPVLGDGVALFHSSHGNLGTASKLSIDSLGTARSAMRMQKDISGLSYIDPQPKYLIVPVALETHAEQLLASLVDPSKNNNTPNLQFIRGLTLIADPRLDANSPIAWYLSAAPTQIEGILRAYLAGEPRPYLEESHEFDRDAISYKVRLDFAAGVIDYRGLYKNPGA